MTVTHPQHAPIRPDWLALHHEEPLDPARPIIDAHTHLYDRPGHRYLLPEMLADLDCGHNIVATVYVQARAMYRLAGPKAMRPVGETEFANGIAAMSASGGYGPSRVCAAIVAAADLTMGTDAGPVLDAHLRASSRLRGIRQTAAWDEDTSMLNPAYRTSEDMLASEAFRAGFRELAGRGLSFDAWLFFHQLPRLADLARAFPEVPIILNHCGGLLGVGPYAGRGDEVHAVWKGGMAELAGLSNLHVKIGGLGMRMVGLGLDARSTPATSEQLADAWRPWVHEILDLFGPDRCMFETNFPVDKSTGSYGTFWNAFKRLVQGASDGEKDALFHGTAARVYRPML